MYRVTITNKRTKEVKILESGVAADQAIRFCESWGWSYSDEHGKDYWLNYEPEEIKREE